MRTAGFALALLSVMNVESLAYGAKRPQVITRYSVLEAVKQGVFEGNKTLADLKRLGDFGVGTFHGFDGEMVFLDGKVYQINSEGVVTTPSNKLKTPYFVTTFFHPQSEFQIEAESTLDNVKSVIDSKLVSLNYFHAVKITGRFKYMKARSVFKQEIPYKPLADIPEIQRIFEFSDIEGTVVAFRNPSFVKGGIDDVGYHMHFISKDKTAGGHVFDFIIDEGKVEMASIAQYNTLLPVNELFMKAVLP
jgi:acetolactate decarboxylase